ncbi:LYR motif-containing protein 9 isoform X2 [Coccinella septempunctata]|uniref:LYR motif-containing protein 9 isoform X2 n=1 Tax=Coccinella septempunctata TaxID=41139 RepID=UPI001D079BFB|nr:LYR motif-containing protein 9 isoform X2 [Coccinella septempunctata]
MFSNAIRKFSSIQSPCPKRLFKYLLRQCDKLPSGPKQYYKFQIKQSFKQHKTESDPERIREIIRRSYEDAEWVIKKYFPEKS